MTESRFYRYVFAVGDEAYCCWDYDLPARNERFLRSLDGSYFSYVSGRHLDQIAGEDRQRASVALRGAYHHGLETLFSLLGAMVQAPEAVPAWIPKCSTRFYASWRASRLRLRRTCRTYEVRDVSQPRTGLSRCCSIPSFQYTFPRPHGPGSMLVVLWSLSQPRGSFLLSATTDGPTRLGGRPLNDGWCRRPRSIVPFGTARPPTCLC